MPKDHYVGIPATVYDRCLENVRRTALVAPTTQGQQVNTLQTPPLGFTYLDCGRWGGTEGVTHREFGLVWGKWAALCEFRSVSGSAPPQIGEAGNPLNAVLAALSGPRSSVQIIDHAWSRSPVEPDGNSVYVILPDFHLPVVRRLPRFNPELPGPGYFSPDGPAMGREGWPAAGKLGYLEYDTDEEGTRVNRYGDRVLCDTAIEWYHLCQGNDIFQQAEDDLLLFLERLATYKGEKPLHLVHLGDMYELWNGLDRYFERNGQNRVILRWNPPSPERDPQGRSATEFINYWVKRSNGEFSRLVAALDSVPIARKTYIWGNHDNYLAAHTPPGIQRREQEIRKGGIFIEHGHRGDGVNRDGANLGHWLANRNFGSGNALRSVEPFFRDGYLETPAYSFADTPNFCVYVMGHTHRRFLANVWLRRRRPTGHTIRVDEAPSTPL